MIEPKQIIRSKRKSIALVVNNEGELIVRVPYAVSQAEIMRFVNRKQDWIKNKLNAVKIFDKKYSVITISNGNTVVFLGENYTIDIAEVGNIIIDGKTIYIPNYNSKVLLLGWLREQALSLLKERTKRYSQLMGVKPTAVKISEAKSRWGSCSQNNILNFAWRLIMSPVSVIDYVVVHELSHITYKDHSKAFWVRVKTVLPNYIEQQNWLKANKKLMDII
jgi:predicted metal-dependent hydrolase